MPDGRRIYISYGYVIYYGMGFQLSMPFMSLYIKTLGHFDRFQLNMWSGLAFSATYLVSSWMAPIWGKIADRHGRKKVMLISTIGDGAMVLCMAFVQHAYQLALFRLLQGSLPICRKYISADCIRSSTKHSGKALSTYQREQPAECWLDRYSAG